MKKEQELYVSFSPNVYKRNKAEILNSQIELLDSLKKINKIELLRKERIRLKNYTLNLIKQASENLKELEEEFPKPRIPKEFQIKTKKQEPFEIRRRNSSEENEENLIDKELKEIQEKLRALNN